MSKSFIFKRFSVRGMSGMPAYRLPDGEGEYVLAQDALDREAVLQARIRTLEVQLTDAKRDAAVWRARYEMTRPTLRPAD